MKTLTIQEESQGVIDYRDCDSPIETILFQEIQKVATSGLRIRRQQEVQTTLGDSLPCPSCSPVRVKTSQ